MTEEKVPDELSRLWRLPAESRLGRPAGLDVERVVRAAVELADRDGLGGVTLLKVARELGVTKMSLYRHVGSKGELFVLMGDLALGAAPEIGVEGGWRDGLRQWAHANHAVYLRRPWMVYLPVSGPPGGPNAISWMDALLRVLRDAGLGWGTKVGLLSVLAGYVRQASVVTQQLEDGRREAGLDQVRVERDYGRALAGLVDPARFPDAAKLFASPVFMTPESGAGTPADEEFLFGLELILDGVAATIENAS
jgi:AcrR family transcriptional regulator